MKYSDFLLENIESLNEAKNNEEKENKELKFKPWKEMSKDEKKNFGKKAVVGTGVATGVALGANFLAKKMTGEETLIDKMKNKIFRKKIKENYEYLYENFSELPPIVLESLSEYDFEILNELALGYNRFDD